MKKSFFIVLICVCLLLACCNSSNQNSSDIADDFPSTQETEPVEIKDYPEYIYKFSSVSYFYMAPDEVFTSTAEKNGLSGTVYTILGRITEYIYDENGEIEAYRVFTPKGDVLVGDFYNKIIEEVANDDTFSSIEPVLLRGFLPVPPENEFIRIYAEYQGTSSDFGYEYDLPFFLYGGTDYLANIMIASAHIPDETTPEETVGVDTAPAEAPATTGELNALQSALSYLDFSAFSYEGLIDQLEYEGFTNAEATYAADHCGADWNEQALKSAKNYLDFSAFSYDGLIDQLEYEEFTTEQATYGADNCGADWYAQAVKCAASYLDYT